MRRIRLLDEASELLGIDWVGWWYILVNDVMASAFVTLQPDALALWWTLLVFYPSTAVLVFHLCRKRMREMRLKLKLRSNPYVVGALCISLSVVLWWLMHCAVKF